MIYLDNTTTTQMDERVLPFMKRYQTEEYGVAISDYSPSFLMKSKEALKNAQEIIAGKINCKPEEITFTSGQAESNNQVLKGVKGHIITTKIEHSSIIETCKDLEKKGYSITYIGVDKEGFIDLGQLKKSLRNNTVLVSIQHANQEVGTIQDIKKIGLLCREHKILFHVDASQSFLKELIDVQKMNIDLLTLTAHLIHGPKGIGALYIRNGTKLEPLVYGTRIFDIPGIAGFGEAIKLWGSKDIEKMRSQKEKLIKELKKIPNTSIFGPINNSLPNTLFVGFKFIEGESIVLYLDTEGIVLSTGSACAGKGLRPSHVLEAMGYNEEYSHGSIRIGLSRFTTSEEIDITLKKIKEIVEKLRKMSPIKK